MDYTRKRRYFLRKVYIFFVACVFQLCGVDNLFPDAVIDDYLFDPCGYSANGVMDDVSDDTIFFNVTDSCTTES